MGGIDEHFLGHGLSLRRARDGACPGGASNEVAGRFVRARLLRDKIRAVPGGQPSTFANKVSLNIAVLFRMPCGIHIKTRQIVDLTGNFQALRPIRLPRFRRGNARL